MFFLKPVAIKILIIEPIVIMKGKEAKTTREKLQPLEKAKARPATDIAQAIKMEPTLSPIAFYIAMHSLPILALSSEGLLTSNQALSYLRIDSK
jgi:hypothetical protein